MKRLTILLLILILLFSFPGCGSAEHTATVPSSTPAVTAPSSAPTAASAAPEATPTEPATISTTVPPTVAETEPALVIQAPEPDDEDLVRICDHIPGVQQELMYATAENFTGQPIYDFSDAFLRYGTIQKLLAVSEELAKQGLYLKIWDGFRPVSAQFALWEVCPDPTYVADPTRGHSSHSRGNTVDLTLVDADGLELEMPACFDDFSARADRDYSDCTEGAAANALLLQNTMEKHGFQGYYGEWWHFSDTESYPVEESFRPVSPSWWYADCNEYISLRTDPDTSAEVITRIPVGQEFQVLAINGDFAWVDFQGVKGYVLRSYTQPVQ